MKYTLNHFGSRLIVIMVLGCCSISCLYGQDTKKMQDAFETTYNNSLQTIEYGIFKFSANLIYDGVQREKNMSTLTVNNNQLDGVLLPFSDKKTELIKFNEQALNNYRVYKDERKKVVEVSFNVLGNTINYQFKIKVMPNGHSILKVINNSDSIEYRGIIERI